ncbi:hypothetical protein EDB89DRAFT_1953779 [Lactarius sanguifluus]|nr:hypothetical protein EDB89DRAFT_1953779 [Lactarius sanguifluus]
MAKFVHQLIPLFILATLLLPLPLSILETRSGSNNPRSATDLRPRSDGRVRCSWHENYFFCKVIFAMLHDTAWPPPIYL